ncbi:unnamed protein product, partial [Didymodactylos carnosus]
MIADKTDETELSRLLQLVLGVAVSCDRKQYYIENIMLMEESVQHVLMNAIQELKHALEELNRVVEAKEEIENRCRELDLQVSTLQDEKLGLTQETSRLNDRIQQFESLEDSESIPKRRYATLQQRIQSQQEEIFKLETTLQDHRAKLDVLRDDNEGLLKRTKLESTIDAYKLKLEEMSNLRQQIEYLEETNLRLFDEKTNLEHEYKKAKQLQTQVEF